jgi:hypothetical protein
MVSARFAPPRPSRLTASWARHRDPHSAVARWGVRAAFALPLCVLALWAEHRGFAGSANRLLQERSDAARGAGGDMSGLRDAYPPLPTLLAGILPGGTAGVAVCTGVLAGIAMQLVTFRLARRQVSVPLAAALLLALIGVPVMWFEGTQNLSGFLALMFLVIAIDGFVRFVAREDTVGGFVAGLMLAAAFLCDPVALVYTAALGVAAPFLAPRDLRHQSGAMRATASVLVFPTIAVVGAWAFLEWRFTGGAYATIRHDQRWFAFDHGVLRTTLDALRWTGEAALRSPVYLCVGVLLMRRRAVVAFGYAVPLAGLFVARWIGMEYSVALAFALLTLVGLYSVPRPGARGERWLLGAAALVQLVLALAWAPDSAEFHAWADAIRWW